MSELDLSDLKSEWRHVRWFYRVGEYVQTLVTNPDEMESFSNEKDFKDKNLLVAKKEAEEYYKKRLKGFRGGKFFLPYAGPDEYVLGENSAFSIYIAFVELHANGEESEHYLCDYSGKDHQAESIELEKTVLREKGYI
jgi:hypothetical protein